MHKVETVQVPAGSVLLTADLRRAPHMERLVVFAHGSGSGRLSLRNARVAERFAGSGTATLLLDLLTDDEQAADAYTAQYRFDMPRLGQRVTAAIDWVASQADLGNLPLGLFGASTGAAAALIAAADRPALVRAVVSRGGRPDLAALVLGRVKAPTLLIVGGRDRDVLALNRSAMSRMTCPVEVVVVPGATHLFEEAGALARVTELASTWFERHLQHSARTSGIPR